MFPLTDDNSAQYLQVPIKGMEKRIPLSGDMLISSEGFNHASRQVALRRKLQLLECKRMWEGFQAGEIHPMVMKEAFQPRNGFVFDELHKLAPHIFHEAMTRSDFTNLTTYVLDRIMLDNWAAYPSVYQQLARVKTNIRDFRSVERWYTDGGERTWDIVEEMAPFNRQKVDTNKYTYYVQKYESGMQVSWEAIINDDMDMFRDGPARLALGGRRTIEAFFAKLIADTNGPNASFYTTGNGNVINTTGYGGGSANPVLSYDSLSGAIAQWMNLRTVEGRPLSIGGRIFVVVADGFQHRTLMNIINTQMIATTIVGGTKQSAAVTPDTQLQIRNWIAGQITPVYFPELRNIVTASSGAVAAKSWWMFLEQDSVARPAIEIGHLSGFDSPQMFRKLPNTVRVSGGGAEEFGDFETMGTEFKGLLVVGGTRMDPRSTMASNGSGS